MDDIADHAGLGVGTAYRHFPNKYALADAIFDDAVAAFVNAAQAVLTEPDPWDALVGVDRAHPRGADRQPGDPRDPARPAPGRPRAASQHGGRVRRALRAGQGGRRGSRRRRGVATSQRSWSCCARSPRRAAAAARACGGATCRRCCRACAPDGAAMPEPPVADAVPDQAEAVALSASVALPGLTRPTRLSGTPPARTRRWWVTVASAGRPEPGSKTLRSSTARSARPPTTMEPPGPRRRG